MPRTCSVCAHEERSQIDREIIAHISFRDIAGRFDLSKSAVERHASGHIPAAIAKAAELVDALTAQQLVGELRTLRDVTIGVLTEARSEGDHSAALGAIARLEKQAELCARLAGELVERHEVTARALVFDAEWIRLRGLVLSALYPFPEALAAVRRALGSSDAPA